MLHLGAAASDRPLLRIALLHMAPVPGDLAGNRLMIENAIDAAWVHKARWIVTPELCVSGYDFTGRIGTDWIEPLPDQWVQRLSKQIADLGVTLFLGTPEKDPVTGRLHNTVLVIGPDGRIQGKHRKIRTIKKGAESWSSPGVVPASFPVAPVGNVGLLICADAYPAWIAQQLKKDGADILISSASWCKAPFGPAGEWERCSKDTGLTMIVCNRTGMDKTLDFKDAESVVICHGKRIHTMTSHAPAIFMIEVDPVTKRPVSTPPVKIGL